MSNVSTFAVSFFTRRLVKQREELSIYARITVSKKKAELSLQRKIPAQNWDSTKSRLRGATPQIKQLNKYLDQVYFKFMDIHKQFLEKDKEITAKAIKASYLGKDEDYKRLSDIINYHNEHMKSVLKWGTIKNYRTTTRYLEEFVQVKFHKEDIFLKHLNYEFISGFEHFLRTYTPKKKQRTCTNNGVMKHIARVKKIINLAVKLEWLQKDPFKNFKLKFNKTDRQYLSDRELKLVEETIFKSESLERVKDIFLFSCYSGLSYIDLKNLTKDQILKGIDDKNWIFTRREKTNEVVKVPLLNKADQILKKYENHCFDIEDQKVLPVLSNQKMNDSIKKVMKGAGVKKHISFHCARHTFATTVTLANGVPIETVSKLLGHTKLSTTQIYARVLENKLSNDIANLEKAMARKSKKSDS